MLNCTNHFNLRWTQRVVEITTENEIKDYIAKNKDMISEHANISFEHAKFIYKGQIGDNVTRNYYIKDEMIFVTNVSDDAFVTLYKVDLGLPDKLNKTIVKGLLEEIDKLHEEKYKIDFEVLTEVEDKVLKKEQVEEQIAILKEQQRNLEKEKEFLESDIKNTKSKSLNTGLELRKYVIMLVNSKEYKNDITTMK